jgi:cytidylate kinase
MSGGRAVAEAVAASLGYPCIGREILTDAAVKLGVSPELLGTTLDRVPGVWDRVTAQRRGYLVGLQAALAEHVAKGDLVYHSYAGHLLLRGVPGVLRVRIIAPVEARVREAMAEEGLDSDAAEARVRRSDEARARWTRIMYGMDWADPALYDMVLNLEQLSVGDACASILQVARQPKFAATPETRERHQDFALTCRVKLALEQNPASRGLPLEVSAQRGVVTVTGVAPEAAMPAGMTDVFRRELNSVVAGVEGVQAVQLNLRTVAVASLT